MICDRVREKGLCLNDCTVDSEPCEGFKNELAISAYSKRLFGKNVRFTIKRGEECIHVRICKERGVGDGSV